MLHFFSNFLVPTLPSFALLASHSHSSPFAPHSHPPTTGLQERTHLHLDSCVITHPFNSSPFTLVISFTLVLFFITQKPLIQGVSDERKRKREGAIAHTANSSRVLYICRLLCYRSLWFAYYDILVCGSFIMISLSVVRFVFMRLSFSTSDRKTRKNIRNTQ